MKPLYIRIALVGALGLAVVALMSFSPAVRAAEGGNAKAAEGPVQLTGEVVDLMCYLDHGAHGQKHAECAKTCISGGGPVGLLVENAMSNEKSEQSEHEGHEKAEGGKESHGQLYLVVGDHAPINDKLAGDAGKTVTLEGKVVRRNGMRMIEDARVVKVGDLVQ